MQSLNGISCKIVTCDASIPEVPEFGAVVLFISAASSGQSKEQLTRLGMALRVLGAKASDLTLLIMDTDKIDTDYINRMLATACNCPSISGNHLGGYGEMLFIRDRQVISAVAHRTCSIDDLTQRLNNLLSIGDEGMLK